MIDMTAVEIAKAAGGELICGQKSTIVDNVQIDSGDCVRGSLFVPLMGERTDAHDYIRDAYEHGAVAVFTSRGDILENTEGLVYIRVKDTRLALQRLGCQYRIAQGIPIIGVTGSVGKTSTKEMLANVLGAGLKVIKTKGNWNSQVGLPRMMLELSPDYDVAIIEMGMSLEGEMARLADIAAPQLAVITNIGVSHIGNLGSREAIMREKLSIINGFEDGGCLLLNGDDDMLMKAAARERIMVTEQTLQCLEKAIIETYGFSKTCDYRAENVRETASQTRFDFVYRKGGREISEQMVLNVIGTHNVYNALAALAAAMHFGVPVDKASRGLLEYRPGGMRGEITKIGDVLIINDAYNASPDSVKSGLELLMKTEADRHIAVLADVLELGTMSRSCHLEIGRLVSDMKPDVLLAIGSEARYIAEGAGMDGSGINISCFDNNEEALEWLKKNMRQGDAVLFKGSRGMHLEEIIDGLR